MPKITVVGQEYETDAEGFLQEPEKWNKQIAEEFAKTEATSYPMTEDHWKVVNYIRNYYMEYDIAPPIRMLVKSTGLSLDKINELFPNGPAKGACKIAGLAKPTGCQ
jgi:dissimilatory sulfite reductase related protein